MLIDQTISSSGHYNFSIVKPSQLQSKAVHVAQNEGGLQVYVKDENINRIYPVEKHMLEGLPKLNFVPQEFFENCYSIVKNYTVNGSETVFGVDFRGRLLGGGRDWDNKAGRGQYAQWLTDSLQNSYPGYNVLVVNDRSNMQINIPRGSMIQMGTETYNTRYNFKYYVFRYGTVLNKGDGGYINWSFSGQFARNGKHVTFKE